MVSKSETRGAGGCHEISYDEMMHTLELALPVSAITAPPVSEVVPVTLQSSTGPTTLRMFPAPATPTRREPSHAPPAVVASEPPSPRPCESAPPLPLIQTPSIQTPSSPPPTPHRHRRWMLAPLLVATGVALLLVLSRGARARVWSTAHGGASRVSAAFAGRSGPHPLAPAPARLPMDPASPAATVPPELALSQTPAPQAPATGTTNADNRSQATASQNAEAAPPRKHKKRRLVKAAPPTAPGAAPGAAPVAAPDEGEAAPLEDPASVFDRALE